MTTKQACGSRLGSLCGSRTKAIQKNKDICNSVAPLFIELNGMRPAMAKMVVHPCCRSVKKTSIWVKVTCQ